MHYKNLVRGIVDEIYVDMQKSPTNFGDQRIFDEVSGNYLLYQNSWINQKRIYGGFLYIEVRDTEKIWVHHDGTKRILVQQLLDLGVPKSDIVMAWRSPEFRRNSEFVVA